MKVLHINTYDSAGGAEKIAYTLYKHQKNSTFLVKRKLKYFDDENIIEFKSIVLDKAFALLDKVVWKLGYKKELRTLLQAGDQFHFTYRKLKALKAYQEADIVHLHNLHGNYFDISALKLIAKEKKIVWTVHDMWPITGGDAYLYEENDYVSEYLDNSRLFYKYPLNGPIIDRREYFLKYKKNIFSQFSKNIFFVPVSNWLKSSILTSKVYHADMQIEVIYNGIDTTKFMNSGRRSWQLPRVLFFNSDNPFKGSEFFIHCLQKLNTNFELFVVGHPIQSNINSRIKVYYLDKTTDEYQLADYFNKVDILVFPSTAESFGLLPAEAMLCGVMVLSSDAGGLNELVHEGKTGMLFKNGNAKDLVSKLEQILTDLNRSRQIGANSREYVLSKFILANMLKEYDKLYEKASIGLIPKLNNLVDK